MEVSINGARILATLENVPLFGTLNVTQTLVVSWLVMAIITGVCIWLGSGLKVTGIMVAAQGIAGFIAGMGGGAELLGMYNRFKWTATPGYGWTGIVVALLARRNPLMVPLAACFIAYMNVGADIMPRNSDVGREMVSIIQGVMMLLIAADALLQGWKQRMIVKAAKAEEEAQK